MFETEVPIGTVVHVRGGAEGAGAQVPLAHGAIGVNNADGVARHHVPFAPGAIGAINDNGIGKRLVPSGSTIKVCGGAEGTGAQVSETAHGAA